MFHRIRSFGQGHKIQPERGGAFNKGLRLWEQQRNGEVSPRRGSGRRDLHGNEIHREDGRPEEHASYAGLSERWVSACSLKKGDRVLLSDGKSGTVERTVCVKLAAPETTYNFEVADFHTYYVGNNGVLVHNTDCSNPGGRHGGKAHREKVQQVKQDLIDKGWTVSEKEIGIRTAKGKLRYPDITATKDGVTRFYQIGRQTKFGKPIAREVRALRDIGSVNKGKVFFIPYN